LRTPGREKIGGTAEQGYLHCGPNGGGHFVKMVHNGIEYGLMAAYAEGLGILRDANIGKQQHEVDAETTPLRDPEQYQYDFNLRDITEVWRRGSVVASWLLDLTAAALVEDPDLKQFAGRVSDSGEGRWTIKAASSESEAESVEMVFNRLPGPKDMDAYERVLTDAMDGDATLFARQDYVEEAWRIVDPALQAGTPLFEYEPQTWGPKELERVSPPGGWQDPVGNQ